MVDSSSAAPHLSKPLLGAVTSSFAAFLKALPVGRAGQVTCSKRWLWSLAPIVAASQGAGAKSTKLRQVLQVKLAARSGEGQWVRIPLQLWRGGWRWKRGSCQPCPALSCLSGNCSISYLSSARSAAFPRAERPAS